MFYLTKFLAPDPFIFLKKVDTDPVIVVNQMEYCRAQKQSIVEDVRSYFDYKYLEVVKTMKEPHLGTMKFIAKVRKKELGRGTKFVYPMTFQQWLLTYSGRKPNHQANVQCCRESSRNQGYQ